MMHHTHNTHHPHVHPSANVHHPQMHHQGHPMIGPHPQVSINVGPPPPHPHVQHHMQPPPQQSAGLHGHRERMNHHPSRINPQQHHQATHLPQILRANHLPSVHSIPHHKQTQHQQQQSQQQQSLVLHNGPNMMGNIPQQQKKPHQQKQQPQHQNVIVHAPTPSTQKSHQHNKTATPHQQPPIHIRQNHTTVQKHQQQQQQQQPPIQQQPTKHQQKYNHQHQQQQQQQSSSQQQQQQPLTHKTNKQQHHVSPTPAPTPKQQITILQSSNQKASTVQKSAISNNNNNNNTSAQTTEKLKNVPTVVTVVEQPTKETKATSPSAATATTVVVEVTKSPSPVVGVETVTEETDLHSTGSNIDDSNSESTVSNNKEKTPMCLVNEMARYNKIPHQYHLTSEQGPAHKKSFTVTLKLGNEEYTSEGMSIKKAQHSAASKAITQTAYKHPPVKSRKNAFEPELIGNVTPTVELNALAMKRGETTVYNMEAPKSVPPPHLVQSNVLLAPNYNVPFGTRPSGVAPIYPSYNLHFNPRGGGRNGFQPRLGYHRDKRSINGRDHRNRFYDSYGSTGISDEPFKVTLEVSGRTYTGTGMTPQAARHDAAARALEVIKYLTPEEPELDDSSVVEDPNSELKSPVSLVYEMALKRNLTVAFEVQSEKGPPHMKTFISLCKVGNITTEGEGNRKRMSKKRAAEKMVDELRSIPPSSPIPVAPVRPIKVKRKGAVMKKKTRNLIKENIEPEILEDVNPISRLSQVQQARREKEPVYSLVEERGARRRHEFVIQVTASGMSAEGVGSNKKVAKRIAAERLLELMGIPLTESTATINNEVVNIEANDAESGAPIGPSNIGEIGTSSVPVIATVEKSRKVTFKETPKVMDSAPVMDSARETITIAENNNNAVSTPTITAVQQPSNVGGSSGRQIAPGLLLMQDTSSKAASPNLEQQQHTAAMAKELLKTGPSACTEASKACSPSSSSSTNTASVKHREKLQYLAALLGFEVSYEDFMKGNHDKCLTLVSLSTEPPQICHGEGNTTEESCEQAAKNVLEMLAKLNLDRLAPKKDVMVDNRPSNTTIHSNGLKK